MGGKSGRNTRAKFAKELRNVSRAASDSRLPSAGSARGFQPTKTVSTNTYESAHDFDLQLSKTRRLRGNGKWGVGALLIYLISRVVILVVFGAILWLLNETNIAKYIVSIFNFI